MKNLVGKVMMCLACAIIMMHAVVPHHHHDAGCGVGLVFETEIGCHCDDEQDVDGCATHHRDACCHHDHGSKHPFDVCKLQELLSHLVLNTKDDKMLLAALLPVLSHDFQVDLFIPADSPLLLAQTEGCGWRCTVGEVPLPNCPAASAVSRRGPPCLI